MKCNISVESADSSLSWYSVFQVLGIKRCQAMLEDIGVPDKIVSEPSGITKAAYEFWQSVWRERDELSLYGSNPKAKPDTLADYYGRVMPEYYKRVKQRVERAFSIIETEYGEDVADSLYKWADRLFVDPKVSRQLSFWLLILLGIEEQEFAPEELISKTEMIDDVILRHLGYPAELHFEKQLELANQISLSPIEKRMIELEMTQPNDSAEVDLSVLLHFASQQHRVYLVWKNFMEFLSPSEIQSIRQWARELVEEKQTISKLDEEFLSIPDLS
jgi:hypothetical protein